MAGGGDEASAALCAPMKATSEGLWQGDNPLHFSLPLIILQVCLVLVLTRGLALALRQPRVIAEIIVSCSVHPIIHHASLYYSYSSSSNKACMHLFLRRIILACLFCFCNNILPEVKLSLIGSSGTANQV